MDQRELRRPSGAAHPTRAVVTRVAAALAAASLVSGCGDGSVAPPQPEAGLFDRYVALGNSITAGFESEGINDSTQMHAYPVLLAQHANVSLSVALLNTPGCPPPLVGPVALTSDRVGGGSATSCAGLGSLTNPVQSLAVPGFRIADVFAVPGGLPGLIYSQAFGNRTLVQAMVDAGPTLVSVWLGNNDALSAGLSGDLDLLTPAPQFQSRVNALAGAIRDQTNAREAIWISVIDPRRAPVLQPGAYFWGIGEDPATAPLLPKPVHENCAPFLPGGDPNPLAANLVSFTVARDDAVSEISCADDAPYVLNAPEREALGARVAEFNAAIQEAADAHGWIYIDANALIEAELSDPDRIRDCQGLLDATTDDFPGVLKGVCPHPDAPNFFGSLLSFDGVHPSLAGQELVADALRDALRAKHPAAF